MLISNSIIQSLNVAYSSFMLAGFAVILNPLINPIIYCIRVREFRVTFIEILCRKTTAQAKNTKKSILGTKNNGVTHESGVNGEIGMKKMKQEQQQHGVCEQINSESNNGENIGDNDTNKAIAMKTKTQEQQQHGRCTQINGGSNIGNDNIILMGTHTSYVNRNATFETDDKMSKIHFNTKNIQFLYRNHFP